MRAQPPVQLPTYMHVRITKHIQQKTDYFSHAQFRLVLRDIKNYLAEKRAATGREKMPELLHQTIVIQSP